MKTFAGFLIKAVLFCLLVLGVDRLLDRFMLCGLNRYYGLNGDSGIVLVGPSQIMLGVDKVQLEQETKMSVAKYTREGVSLKDRYEMLRHYYASCTKPPKIVILNVDKYLFSPQGLSLNSYRLFFPFMSTPSMNRYIRDNATAKEYWLRQFFHVLRYDDILLGHTLRGYLRKWDNLKCGTVDIEGMSQEINSGRFQPRKVSIDEDEVACLKDILQFLLERNAIVVLLDIPYISPVENYLSDDTALVRQYFLDAENENPNIHYLRLGELAENGSFYADKNHLNPDGQKVATTMLSSYLGKILIEK